ncbi:hypothetical protein ABT024_05145 [Streptomyces sp. NPDC002812]|uniref:hypothetical protein n=1 Tax=Streptomyces sp. NPDC002812 TaxID=3154434 RepID=UPI0033177FB2
MPVIDATFYPLIITARPTDPIYRQPPTGTDMSTLRVVTATDVRPGDWVLGASDREINELHSERLYWLMQSVACFPALPAVVNDAVALDGESLVWRPNELILIIPREYLPADAYGNRLTGYRLGDRVERTLIRVPKEFGPRDREGVARPVIQRGTVTAVDDDAFTVAWAGAWSPREMDRTEGAMCLADPARIQQERTTYGFAVGDPVHPVDSTSLGIVLELYPHWYTGSAMARVCWSSSGWDNEGSADSFVQTDRLTHAVRVHPSRVTSHQQYTHTA